MTKEETDNYIKIGLTIGAVILVLYILSKFEKGFGSLFESLGLKDTEGEKKTQARLDAAESRTGKAQPAQSEWQPKDFNYTQPDASIANLNKWVEKARKNKKPLRAATFLPGYFRNNAKALYNSVGIFWDDPEKGLSVFKNFRSKAAVAYFAQDFKNLTGNDLFTWLGTKYDTSRQKEILAQIYNYCDGLPVGIVNTTTNQITI